METYSRSCLTSHSLRIESSFTITGSIVLPWLRERERSEATSAMLAEIAAAGGQATWRYLGFFTANIRNPSTATPTGGPARGSSRGAPAA